MPFYLSYRYRRGKSIEKGRHTQTETRCDKVRAVMEKFNVSCKTPRAFGHTLFEDVPGDSESTYKKAGRCPDGLIAKMQDDYYADVFPVSARDYSVPAGRLFVWEGGKKNAGYAVRIKEK